MHCININHPEYLNLLDSTKENPTVLQYKISLWMDRNSTDRFPTIEELSLVPLGKNIAPSQNIIEEIKKLGPKYLANSKGFMPANINLADLKRDARKLNLTVHRSSRNTWFLKDSNNKIVNPSTYRQIDSQSSTLPYKALTDKLLLWAENHGITVTTIQELMDRSAGPDSIEGSVAAADLLNKIIAINPEKEMSDTLAEEVSHFATNILKDDVSVKKAMENIVDTDIYKEVKENYANIYSKEEDFKKEAVDKLLTQVILEKFEETNNNKGVLSYIKGIWSKFKKWLNKFKKSSAADQIKTELYPIAESILKNEYLGENIDPTATVFHQVNEKPYPYEKAEELLSKVPDSVQKSKLKFIINSINTLNENLSKLRESPKTEGTKKQLKNTIKKLQEDIDFANFSAGVETILEFAEKELTQTEDLLKKLNESKTTNGSIQTRANDAIETYKSIFIEFKEDIKLLEGDFSKEELSKLWNTIDDTDLRMSHVETLLKVLDKKHAITTQDKDNTAPDGSKIDSDYNPQKTFNSIQPELGFWRAQVGNYKLASSPIIRTAHKTLFNAVEKIKRFAVTTGNTLLQSQTKLEKAGYKVEDLIEKDSKGKYTQYLIRKEDWATWNEDFNQMKKELAKKLGFAVFDEINIPFLKKEQLDIYNKSIRNFHLNNSTPVVDDTGTTTVGWKPKKKNPRFEELMKIEEIRNYYNLLIDTKRKALKKQPLKFRDDQSLYLIPGIRSQLLEKFTDNNQGFFHNLKEALNEGLLLDEDDVEFGELSSLNNQMIPIYFNRIFENPGNVSRDLTRSYTAYAKMAENFATMASISGDMNTLQRAMRPLKFKSYGRGREIEGLQSRDYKVLTGLIDDLMYGVTKKDYSRKMEYLGKVFPHLKDKSFSYSKFFDGIAKFISTNNLALNPITSTAGFIKGNIDANIEKLVGTYTTIESSRWANLEFMKNMPEVLSQIGKKKQTNIMHLILQRYNIIQVDKMLKNTNKNKLLSAATSEGLLFVNYHTADYVLKGINTLSVLDNTRLYKDNYVNKEEFIKLKEKEGLDYGKHTQGIIKKLGAGKDKAAIDAEWEKLKEEGKTVFNAYEEVDGVLRIKKEFKKYLTDGVENKTVGNVNYLANKIDGQLSDTDRGLLSRTLLGAFPLMHRNWFVQMIDSRFLKERMVSTTGQKEMGIYNASLAFVRDSIIKNKNFGVTKALAAYYSADPHIKKGVKRTLLDLMWLNIVGIFTAMLNLAADDEDEGDNYLLQLAAYQMNRVLLEQAAGQPAFKWSEILQIMEEPVVGVRTIKDILDISEMFNGKVYERGIYKDWTHSGKYWMRKIPGFKNIWDNRFPKLRNNYLKNNIINSTIYNTLKENANNDDMSILDRLKLIISDDDSKDEKNIMEYIEALENEEI